MDPYSWRIAHRASNDPDKTFNVKTWQGKGGDDYTLSTSAGEVKSTSPHGIYQAHVLEDESRLPPIYS